jgi:hypothetical protein
LGLFAAWVGCWLRPARQIQAAQPPVPKWIVPEQCFKDCIDMTHVCCTFTYSGGSGLLYSEPAGPIPTFVYDLGPAKEPPLAT